MHRLAAVPGSASPSDGVVFIEQPPATAVLLSSADTDLACLAALLDAEPQPLGPGRELRGLNLAALQHPAVLDHWLRTSLTGTELVIVRLLGGRGHWSYGLEQLGLWAAAAPGRNLLVLAGTAEEDDALVPLGTLAPDLALACSRCLREGGLANWSAVFRSLRQLLDPPGGPLPAPAGQDQRRLHHQLPGQDRSGEERLR